MKKLKKYMEHLKGTLYSVVNSLYEKTGSSSGRGRRKTFDIIDKFVSVCSPVIVECGANDGTSTEKFLDVFNDPTIHAIEPVPKHVEELKKRYGANKNVIIHEVALGSQKGKIQINVTNKSSSSSVFGSRLLRTYQEKAGNDPRSYRKESKIEVDQERLDDLIKNVDIVKLDMEGYELEALRGGKNILQKCECIISEVAFVPLRTGQPLFTDIDSFLQSMDFQLYGFDNLRKGADGQLLATHGVWFSKKTYSQNEKLIYTPTLS